MCDYLCCPKCGGTLADQGENHLECNNCSFTAPTIDGIPSFSDPDTYWGEEFNLEQMREINEAASKLGWREAIRTLVEPKSPMRAEYITAFYRLDWRFLVPLEEDWSVLDVGAGWGTLSAGLAKVCRRIVALESAIERARFIDLRVRQDRLDNVRTVHGDLSSTKLIEDSFDLVVMNGVLEWLGWSDTTRNTRVVQVEMLHKLGEAIKPGGYLYIGIENRFGTGYLLGAMDHSYLRFTSLLPRWLAHVVTNIFHRHTYRTYTYSPRGYRKLLESAGYSDIQIYGVMPNYSKPLYYWPLGEGLPVKRLAKVLSAEKPEGFSHKAALAQGLVRKMPPGLTGKLSGMFAPHLLITARKES